MCGILTTGTLIYKYLGLVLNFNLNGPLNVSEGSKSILAVAIIAVASLVYEKNISLFGFPKSTVPPRLLRIVTSEKPDTSNS